MITSKDFEVIGVNKLGKLKKFETQIKENCG